MSQPVKIEAFMLDEHFTAKELAKRWHMSESTVLKLFADEPDVIRIGNLKSRKRTKISVRIPRDVAERIYRRLRGERRSA